MTAWLTVIGIGDDGFAGLGKHARRALIDAAVVVGGERHLAMLPGCLRARREPWPKPFDIAALLAHRGTPVCVLASGDPMFHGVGATLARHVPPEALRVLPGPSSVSFAAARLGWALQDLDVISCVGRPLATLARHLHHGRRLIVLSADGATPAALARLVTEAGYGATRLSVFEHLGGPDERRIDALAHAWPAPGVAALNLVALDCVRDAEAPALGLVPGLPDDAYEHDGQLTKRDMRAITLARLAPAPGERLWDVGAGSGSIGIEWMRAHPSCTAIAIEADDARRASIARNAERLGVPGLAIVAGRAPAALDGLAAPDAIFIGGGGSEPGVLAACWAALKPGGRLVANAVTLQAEAAVLAWRERHGGSLTRVALATAAPLGGFDTWRQALPVTLYEVRKPRTEGG
ncbi:precorrin-6y C5,15-methyltransferase (decarboxylating) subunit CbiE [Burkholderia sp. 22PA0099]|uniref:precorrin-6y C5,15-methyltransferase (decarboxylating) subunit CbiE n=1 Tax=Burkholderia sp. 22PA0099 TaxID=3237372 RepID=UPI0039C1620A